MSAAPETLSEPLLETPLAAHLHSAATEVTAYQGALTPNVYSTLDAELAALTTGAGVFDLGYRAALRITGADRVRWLNGMVTNTIKALPEWRWNYSFLLNAQGRIQGDANVFCAPDTLFFETGRAQMPRLATHLRRYIIMDKVELQPVEASRTTLGIAGPKAAEILSSLGATVPDEGAFATATIHGIDTILIHAHSTLIPRFELAAEVESLGNLWNALQSAGAVACGAAAVEALRILEATPLYGVDIQEKHLAQETGQVRALNFNKGCYLGQEIVERVRSRGNVHRLLRQFSVENAPAALESGQIIELNAEGAERNPVGELTSLAHFRLPAFTGTLALGFVRAETLEQNRNRPLAHPGGTVTLLEMPPSLNQ